MVIKFGFHSTTDDVLAGVDLSGRVAAVTGASGGLGMETARALAAHGAHVVLAARNESKIAEAISGIRDRHPDASVEPLILDLADIRACRAAAVELLRRVDRLDLLINNAGVMCAPFGHTHDGFEIQFGTNHLGHMAWTLELLDLMVCSAAGDLPARVINLSSAGHRFSDVRFDDPNFETDDYDPWVSYGQSKTANILFSVALNKRYRADGIRSIAVHPGGIHTDLGRHLTPDLLAEISTRIEQSNPSGFHWKTVPQGAATTVWAATAADFLDDGGFYCEDCGIANAVDSDAGLAGSGSGGVLPYALNTERADRLWELSERLLATVE